MWSRVPNCVRNPSYKIYLVKFSCYPKINNNRNVYTFSKPAFVWNVFFTVSLASQFTQTNCFSCDKSMTTCTKSLLYESKLVTSLSSPSYQAIICRFSGEYTVDNYRITSRRQLKPLIFILILHTQTIIYNIHIINYQHNIYNKPIHNREPKKLQESDSGDPLHHTIEG